MFSSGGLCQSGRRMAAPDRQPKIIFKHCWSSSLRKKKLLICLNTPQAKIGVVLLKSEFWVVNNKRFLRQCNVLVKRSNVIQITFKKEPRYVAIPRFNWFRDHGTCALVSWITNMAINQAFFVKVSQESRYLRNWCSCAKKACTSRVLPIHPGSFPVLSAQAVEKCPTAPLPKAFPLSWVCATGYSSWKDPQAFPSPKHVEQCRRLLIFVLPNGEFVGEVVANG